MHGVRFVWLVAFALGAAAPAPPQSVPHELASLASAARLDRPIVAWCRGEFRTGHSGAYALAVADATGSGRYLVLESGSTAVELAAFSGGPDISCYTPAAARKLNATIGRSDTIQGHIAPKWNTTVVCGFVENTHAVCWQYSPASRAAVKVGEWTT